MTFPFRNLYKCKHLCFIIVVCIFCLRLFLYCLLLHFCLFVFTFFKLVFIAVLKPRLFSSNTQRVHTKLAEVLLTRYLLFLAFYMATIDVLDGEHSWLRFLAITINLNIVVSLLLLVYFAYFYSCIVCCCIFFYLLFTFFKLVFVVVFKPRLFSSNIQHLHTKLTEVLLTSCLLCLAFYIFKI